MQVDSKFFDDLARVAGGAMGAVSSLRNEIEAQIRQQVERLLYQMDLVRRDEFEVVREMAARARAEQAAYAVRLEALEAALAARPAGPPSSDGR